MTWRAVSARLYDAASNGSVTLADCVSCGTGRSSDAGSGSCSDCPVGTFGAAAVNPTCQSCPVNTFGDETKMSACKVGWSKLNPVMNTPSSNA